MIDCTASIVIYNNPPEMIRRAAESFLSCSLNVELHIVDNSPTDSLKSSLSDIPIQYHFNNKNAGYGGGHNRALTLCSESKYHVIINPDIIIAPLAIESLTTFMEANPNIGIICPSVLNPDGTVQYLNKRYPTVFDLFARRFLPKVLSTYFQKRLDRFEMKDVGYDSVTDVEFTTGCFMFCRTNVLKEVGGFDLRYFLHLEDCDLGRMVQEAGYRTVYFPGATVTHEWGREPHKNYRMLMVMTVSMFKYFNKWGWKFY
jgi:GT2 family glycosyltransferase